MRQYRLLYSDTARRQIAKLHPELKSVVRSRLDGLLDAPFVGKPLERELSGYRSLRASRFRIIYKINEEAGCLEIHYIGHRKDIYELLADRATKM